MSPKSLLVGFTLAALLLGSSVSWGQSLFSTRAGNRSGNTFTPKTNASTGNNPGQPPFSSKFSPTPISPTVAGAGASKLNTMSRLGALGMPLSGVGPQNGQNNNPNQQNSDTGVGVLQGNERFLRGNRKAGEFVGKDKGDSGFVGAQSEAEGIVAPAVDDAAAAKKADPNRVNAVNVPAAAAGRAARRYEPRLAVGFQQLAKPMETVNVELGRQLKSIPGLHPANQYEVSVAGRVATLRGTVASERDRTLAESLLLFEPGIGSVRNELQVKTPSANPPGANPPASDSPSDRGWRSTAK